MENKYLEKVAGLVGGLSGFAGAITASEKDDNALGRSVTGAVAGHHVEKLGDKIVHHGTENFKKLLSKGKATRMHAAALAAGAVGAAAASWVGGYGAGRGVGKLYDKAKEKMTGK